MLELMAKKAEGTGRGPGRPPKDVTRELSLATRGTAEHYRALRTLAERTRERTVSIEILIAIEKHLADNGLWPPTKPAKGRKAGGND
jgi:hypothetical protein